MFLLLTLKIANLALVDMNPESTSFNFNPSNGNMYCFSFSVSSLNHDNDSAETVSTRSSYSEVKGINEEPNRQNRQNVEDPTPNNHPHLCIFLLYALPPLPPNQPHRGSLPLTGENEPELFGAKSHSVDGEVTPTHDDVGAATRGVGAAAASGGFVLHRGVGVGKTDKVLVIGVNVGALDVDILGKVFSALELRGADSTVNDALRLVSQRRISTHQLGRDTGDDALQLLHHHVHALKRDGVGISMLFYPVSKVSIDILPPRGFRRRKRR